MIKRPLVLMTVLAAIALPRAGLGAEAKHGGKVVETNGHHVLELVAGDGVLEVHVMHDGAPQVVARATGAATILSGGKKQDIALAPSGESSLRGSGAFKPGPGTIVVVTLRMPGHKPEQARLKLD